MMQRDLLKDQIEQLGKAIGKLIANFLDLKTEGSIISAIEITNEELKSEIGLDVEKLAELEAEELEEYLKSGNLTDGHLDQLANHFFDIGMLEEGTADDRLKYLLITKKLLDFLDRTSSTITFGRMGLREKVEGALGS